MVLEQIVRVKKTLEALQTLQILCTPDLDG